MSVSALNGSAAAQSYQPVQARVQDKDHDGDNDATESAAAKGREARASANPNLGTKLDTVA